MTGSTAARERIFGAQASSWFGRRTDELRQQKIRHSVRVRRRRRSDAQTPTGDPLLDALRDADAAYHGLCIDMQEPMVPIEELRLGELAEAVERLGDAIEALRRRS